ncbi:MAG: hypothetical protein O7F70_04390 [Gemmatimonadetes bacterium]|nr:hypothetical protein [Gemmatimonadota bacterium]
MNMNLKANPFARRCPAAGRTPFGRVKGQAGMSLVELMIAIGVLMGLMGLVFQSFASLGQSTSQQFAQSYATATVRGAMELLALSLRNDFVHFNSVVGTPLGVNFDLNGDPVVRDGLLYYFDRNHTAQIYKAGAGGEVLTTGLDDENGDGLADVIGVGLVRQDLNSDGVQDFIDLNNDGLPDDVDGDGNPDPLWTLTRVQFDSIGEVTDADLWRDGAILATNLYIRRLDPEGPLSGPNVDTFQFSAHSPLAMLYDTAAFGGNVDGTVDEPELGRMHTPNGIIDKTNEIAAIDSITITLHVAEVAIIGSSRRVVRGDISSDLITPRTLGLMRSNGIVGVPDPTQAVNVD